MEEDLKILEKFLNKPVKSGKFNKISNKEIQALEQLIKAYKELKGIEENHRKENGELREKVKQLEEEREKINKQLDLDYVDNNYIPVYLVKEKIEKLKSKSGGNVFHIQQTINAEIRLLQELLEKRG